MTEHLDDDAVVLLALGQLEAQARTAMAQHLLTCTTCRGAYDEAAAAVEELLPLVPEVQPPVGFESRVLARLGAEPVRPATARRTRRWWMPAAAAVVAVVAAAAVLVAFDDDGGRATPAVAALTRPDGEAVGSIALIEERGAPAAVVAVTDAPRDAPYSCRMVMDDGTVIEAGPWTPHDGHGAWTVPLPDDGAELARVDLVIDATGDTWSSARFEG